MQKEASAPVKKPESPAALVYGYVARQLRGLQNTNNEALTRATLAELRRGIGKLPASLPKLWGITMDGMPAALVGKGGNPSRGEWACYLALTMFALHQQGKDTKKAWMSQPNHGLGQAVRSLVGGDDDLARVKRRFDQVVTADSPQELAHHLRNLIQLLKGAEKPLDYPALARDLYVFQNPEQRDAVRLSWGRGFYAYTQKEPDDQLTDMQKQEEETP